MLSPFTLEGSVVVLEPMEPAHAEGLARAAAEDRSSYAFTWVPDGCDASRGFIEAALVAQADGHSVPFTVRRRADGQIVGSTRFLDLDVFSWTAGGPSGAGNQAPDDQHPPTVAEIGSTWYSASTQRTAVNTECKLLMLTHAFDVWQVERMTLKTDARNTRSRDAIARLGALFEGVRRVQSPASDGGLRDTAYFSIIASEWPAVRATLTARAASAR